MRRPPCVGPYGGYGDVDGDGWVTDEDTKLVTKEVVERLNGRVYLSPEALARADVNGDGKITVADALLISKYVSGLDDTFPVCPVITVTGKIAELVYWYPGLSDQYFALNPLSPPQVPLNTVLYLGMGWINHGNIRAKGHIDAAVNKPGPTQIPLVVTSGQDQVVNPGAGAGRYVMFEPITLDKAGPYSVSIVLSMEVVA